MFLDAMLDGHEDQFFRNKVIFAQPGGQWGSNLLGLPCGAPTYMDGSHVVADHTLTYGNDFYTMDGQMYICGQQPSQIHEQSSHSNVYRIPADDEIISWR